MMAQWALSNREPGLEPLKENESSECYWGVEFHVVQAIGYKAGELHVEPEKVGGYSGHTNM